MDTVVLIIGSSEGLGIRLAQKYIGLGYSVIIADSSNVDFSHKKLMVYNIDFGNSEELINMFDDIYTRIGYIDILINCTTIEMEKNFGLNSMLNSYLKTTFISSREFARNKARKEYGRIINIVSNDNNSEFSLNSRCVYDDKIDNVTQAIATSLRDTHIKVNSIKIEKENSDLEEVCYKLCENENGIESGRSIALGKVFENVL
ncbi:MAG: SDR family oxidoreductase [Firmicutes bacterium]|jgi:NAD(P)-dependent dehydrogenase (short-subunit alcohol dehydrogenase family)|nr:SDR family oxidoreductase [Bacillota bacterium]